MFLGIIYALMSIVLVIFSRSITTFFHEMGHAIPALIFTDKEVFICLGSYDDISKSKTIKLARLTIYFRLNLLTWMLGLCGHGSVQKKWQNIIILLGGPLASILIVGLLVFIMGYQDQSDLTKSIIVLFLISASFDLLVNIYPSSSPLYLYNGDIMYNDGQQIKKIIQERNLPQDYYDAKFNYDKKEYDLTIKKLEKLVSNENIQDKINSLLIDSYIATGEFDKAIDNMSKYSSLKKMKKEDNAKLAGIFFKLGEYEKALNYYDNALYYNYKNAFLLNERGLTKEKLDDLNGAIIDFKASINYNDGYSKPYVNIAKIYLNKDNAKEAIELLYLAIKVNPKDGDAYFYLGKYYDSKHETQNAFNNFKNAEKLGCQLHGLDFFLANLDSDIKNITK